MEDDKMKNNNCTRKFTEKDLLYLEDMFSWNMQALKLVNCFIEIKSSSKWSKGVFFS